MGSGLAKSQTACADIVAGQVFRMARPIRFQYPGAIYHVMARGDGGKTVFETDDDRKSFVFRLGQVCGSLGWRASGGVSQLRGEPVEG
jgi:hypothetical protein